MKSAARRIVSVRVGLIAVLGVVAVAVGVFLISTSPSTREELARQWLDAASTADTGQLREMTYRSPAEDPDRPPEVVRIMQELEPVTGVQVGRALPGRGDGGWSVLCVRILSETAGPIDLGIRFMPQGQGWKPWEALQFAGCQGDRGEFPTPMPAGGGTSGIASDTAREI